MWNKATDTEESFRNKAIWGSAAVVLVAIAGIVGYYRYYAHGVVPEKVQVTPPPPVQAPPSAEGSGVQHPLPEGTGGAEALPALNDSDRLVRDSLSGLLGAGSIERFLVPENIVRHVVATVDNLPRRKVAVELRPIKATPGEPVVTVQGDVTSLAEADFARYAPFMRLVQSADPQSVAAVYFRLYPLFQQAYEDLGYPGRFFNDRLVEVIDHLLAAPDVQGPIALVQPKVFYEYADPQLEALSAGQKLLIRMGPVNERTLKDKLRALRAVIVQGDHGPAGGPPGAAGAARAQ